MQIMITNAVQAFHTGAAYCCHLVLSNLSPFSLSHNLVSLHTGWLKSNSKQNRKLKRSVQDPRISTRTLH